MSRGEAAVEQRRRKSGTGSRSGILSGLGFDEIKDLLSSDGRTTGSQPPLVSSSTSPGSSHEEETPHRRRSIINDVFQFANKPNEPETPVREQHPPEKSTSWRSRITTDLEKETKEAKRRGRSLSSDPDGRGIRGRDVSKRLEKVKRAREARSKERETKNSEMKSLMEQVASIAAQSRGILRAQPKQSEQQRLMGEIISLMGRMADKMSKLMLATEPEEDKDDGDVPYRMNDEDADAKAEQILVLMSKGEDECELEWKKLEIKSILMSEATRPKRTTEKQKALEGLALGQESSNSTPSKRSKSKRRSRSKGASGRSSSGRSSSGRSTSGRSTSGRSKSREPDHKSASSSNVILNQSWRSEGTPSTVLSSSNTFM